ncbi:response regulator [Novosphingobium sp. Gsoil 351]|nr:response regulator [Novosphingobium sp. Gsoil 351]
MARVLLVEDEALVRMAAEEDLAELGHDVVVAENGDAAFAHLTAGEPFDVLVTDIRMPGKLDGWSLASQARQILPQLGVVYVSGFAGSFGELLPGSKFLKKPYRMAQLEEAVKACVTGPELDPSL